MRTWNDYKNHVNAVDPEMAKDLKETEEIAAIVSAMIEQRKSEVTSYYLRNLVPVMTEEWVKKSERGIK